MDQGKQRARWELELGQGHADQLLRRPIGVDRQLQEALITQQNSLTACVEERTTPAPVSEHSTGTHQDPVTGFDETKSLDFPKIDAAPAGWRGVAVISGEPAEFEIHARIEIHQHEQLGTVQLKLDGRPPIERNWATGWQTRTLELGSYETLNDVANSEQTFLVYDSHGQQVARPVLSMEWEYLPSQNSVQVFAKLGIGLPLDSTQNILAKMAPTAEFMMEAVISPTCYSTIAATPNDTTTLRKTTGEVLQGATPQPRLDGCEDALIQIGLQGLIPNMRQEDIANVPVRAEVQETSR